MRKITLFLMLFCAFVGTALAQVTDLSQLSNDKIYAIKSGRCFLLYSEANADKLSTSTATAISDAERVEDAINNPNQQFKIQKTDDKYYLYSVGAGKYLAKDGSFSVDAVDALEIYDVRANFPNYPWKLCIGGNGLNTQIPNQAATGIIINSWTTADAGNTFQIVDIEEKPLFDALNELSTLVNNAKQELSNKHKVTLQTTNASAPFYLSGTQDADGNTISKAIDNNPATIYGTIWGGAVNHLHYWQVDLVDAANLEEFTFSYVTRANGDDTPTQINVQGSTDGVTFTDIVVLTEELPTAGGATYNSAKIVNNGYRYLRFEVPSTTNNYHPAGAAEVTIAIAEFSMIDTNLNNYSVNDKNKLNAISAAEEVLNASNNTLKNVQDAIVAFNEAMAVGQCLVKYSFTYNGVEKYSQEVNTYVGEEWPAVTVALPYGISAAKPEGTIVAGDVVEGVAAKTIELTDNLPFVAAADYASITKWYYLKIKDASYLSYVADQEYIDLANKSAVDANNKDAYTWAFIGNPFDGFQVVNKGAGSGKILSSSTTIDGDGANTYPVLTDTPVAEGYNTYWTLTATTASIANGFFMGQKGFANNRMNNRGNKLAYWTGGADAGSTFTVEERDLSGATELQAVIDQVEAFVAAGVNAGTTVGYITSESATNVAAALAAAKEAVETKTGCNEAQAALQAAVAAVETIQPEEGKFYVIASAMPESDGRSGQKMYVNNDGGMQFNAENAIANVFQFVSNGNGNFFLKSVERGSFMNTNKGHAAGQETAVATTTADAKAIAIANMGRANAVSLIPEGGAMMHAQASGSSVVAWNNTDNAGASAWIIQEVSIDNYAHTLNVTNAKWATLVLGYNAEIPEGVTVYAVSELNENAATLTEVKNTIPAGAAVLINAAEGAYVFNYTESADAIGANLLKGTTVDANIAENAYVLGMIEGVGVGLYTATMNANEGAAFLNNAFKAYLPKTNNAAQTLRFNFGETTGIEGVIEGTNANAVIFDLSGRRVAKMQKGIYIVNGKKVYVK